MSNFPRVVLTLALLLALLTGIVFPKAIGLAISEDAMDDLIALLPTGTDLRLEIEKDQLSRGWFTSSGTLHLNYFIAALAPIPIKLNFEIDHGPLLFTDNGVKLGFAHAKVYPQISISDIALSASQLPDPLNMDMSVFADFSRTLNLDFTVTPANNAAQQDVVSFAGLGGAVVLRQDQSAEARLTIGNLMLRDSSTGQRIDITNASLLAKTDNINSAVAPSLVTLDLPSISSAGPAPLAIQDLSFSSSIFRQPSNQLITLRQEAKLGAATGDMPLRSGQWRIELSEINEESLTEFYAMLSRLQVVRSSSSTAAIRETSNLTQRLLLLLVNSPLSVNAAFDMDAYDGFHSGEMRLSYSGLPQLRNIMGINIKEAIAASSLALNLDLDHEAVSQSLAGEMIDSLVQEGYVILSNGRAIMNANLQNSIVELNGDVVPVDRFF